MNLLYPVELLAVSERWKRPSNFAEAMSVLGQRFRFLVLEEDKDYSELYKKRGLNIYIAIARYNII